MKVQHLRLKGRSVDKIGVRCKPVGSADSETEHGGIAARIHVD